MTVPNPSMQRTTLPVRLLRQRLLSLLDALPAAASGDVTSVHRARVASRRLREVLPVLAEAADSDALDRAGQQVRRITQALGPIRELDVALGHLRRWGRAPAFPRTPWPRSGPTSRTSGRSIARRCTMSSPRRRSPG